MFDNSFKKYSRLAKSPYENDLLYRAFRFRTISLVIWVLSNIAIIVESLLFGDSFADGTGVDLFFVAFGLTLLVALVSFICFIISIIKFQSVLKRILNKPFLPDEMQEIATYRKQTIIDESGKKKALAVPIIILVLGIFALFFGVGYDIKTNPDSDSQTKVGVICTYIFLICVVIFALSLIVYNLKKAYSQSLQTNRDISLIDKAQGKSYKYDINEDKNLQSLKYLFPTKEIFEKVSCLRKKQIKCVTLSFVFFMVLFFGISFFMLLTKNTTIYRIGFLPPLYLVTGLIISFLLVFPSSKKIGECEKQQKKILEREYGFSLNKQIYDLYENHAKIKGKVIFIGFLLSIVVGFVLAIVSPYSMLSVLSVIVLIISLILNNKFVAELRKKVIPLENKIDELEKVYNKESSDYIYYGEN